jgi:HAE1 family hydrophobic/amphiphilic exporter-1
MWLTRLSIQRPVFVIVLMASLLVMGLYSRSKMQVEERPRVDIPYVTVTTNYPGTGPGEIESQITKPIEDAVSSVNNIRSINSSSQYGVSFVQLEFVVGTNSQVAAQEVRQKIEGARKVLPRDVDPPVVDRFDVNARPVLYLGVQGDRSPKELRFIADHAIKYQLAQVAGVGQVEVSGGQVREIQVRVDKERLQTYGLSINDVVAAVYRANANIPSGHISEGPQDFDARLVGEFQSIDELRQIRLPVQAIVPGQPMVLNIGDVAEVLDTIAEPPGRTRLWYRDETGELQQRPGVGVVVTKLSDANTIEVVDGVKEALEKLEQTLPGKIRFVVLTDSSKNVRAQLEDINVSLILGSLLAVIVVFLFLHNLRGTLICAIAIPTSLIATFIPMYFLGQSLNSMTMLGLSLVVGILVDDSIVVLENIYRHLQRGEPPREAAFNGRTEIGLAAVTITLVDVVVFLPMLWMGGIIGMFFRAFGLTVAVSTLFSLVVSFTVTPWLASRWYRLGEDLETRRGAFRWLEAGLEALDHGYRRLLGVALRNRWHVVVAGFGGLYLCLLWAFPPGQPSRLKIGYFNNADESAVSVAIELPEGSSLEATDALMGQVERLLATVPEVRTMYASSGGIQGGGRSSPERGRQYGQIQVQLYERPDVIESLNPFARHDHRGDNWRQRSDMDVAAEMRKKVANVAGARLSVIPNRGFGGISAPVQVELLGDDLDQLRGVAMEMRQRIARLPGVMNTDISLRPGKPEAQIIVDRHKAAELGLEVSQIGVAIRNSIEGNIDAKYRERGEQFDIRVRLRDEDRASIDQLGRVMIGTRRVGNVRRAIYLKDVCTIRMGAGPTKIERKNRMRKVNVSAYLQPGVPAISVMQLVNNAVADVPLGGVQMSAGGESDRAKTEYPHLYASLLLSIILVYLLMAVLFNNLLHPLTIQLSLPMAFVGAILALIYMDQQLTIISMCGFIMLAGIVQKNAILLVDYTNTLRGRGYSRDAALQEAGPTRLRPILMTTLAMIFGMLPIALAIGRASEARAPLATAVIGGLALSTLLTLLVIPCIYTIFDDAVAWAARKLHLEQRQHELVDQALKKDDERTPGGSRTGDDPPPSGSV